MKWPESGVFPIFRVFWGRLATLPTIRPPTQKSVATPLVLPVSVDIPGKTLNISCCIARFTLTNGRVFMKPKQGEQTIDL